MNEVENNQPKNELWLIIGILFGNIFHTPTTLGMVSLWLIFRNRQLPAILGGKRPQDLIIDLYMIIWHFGIKLFYARQTIKKQDDIKSNKNIKSEYTDNPNKNSNNIDNMNSPTVNDINNVLSLVKNNSTNTNTNVPRIANIEAIQLNNRKTEFNPNSTTIPIGNHVIQSFKTIAKPNMLSFNLRNIAN